MLGITTVIFSNRKKFKAACSSSKWPKYDSVLFSNKIFNRHISYNFL